MRFLDDVASALRRPAVFAALCWLGAGTAASGAEPAIAVIVGHGKAPGSPLSRTEVLGIYARKRQFWDDHSGIVAVNLPASNPTRRNFSLWLFKRYPEDLQSYWNEQYFHGLLPPPVLGSEEAVLRFVASTDGALGYVSACVVDKRVEVVALIAGPDGAGPCPH